MEGQILVGSIRSKKLNRQCRRAHRPYEHATPPHVKIEPRDKYMHILVFHHHQMISIKFDVTLRIYVQSPKCPSL